MAVMTITITRTTIATPMMTTPARMRDATGRRARREFRRPFCGVFLGLREGGKPPGGAGIRIGGASSIGRFSGSPASLICVRQVVVAPSGLACHEPAHNRITRRVACHDTHYYAASAGERMTMAVQERQSLAEGAVDLPEPWRSAAVTVVLPTYNEAANLPVIVAELLALPLTNVRILVADDNSPDGTGRVADELAAEHGPARITVAHRPGKQGLGRAYVDGMTQ